MSGLAHANNFQKDPPQLFYSIKDLVKDTKFLILEYFSVQELKIIFLVNKEFSILCRSDRLWKEKLFQRSFCISQRSNADFWDKHSKFFEVGVRQLSRLISENQISDDERVQEEERLKEEIKTRMVNFLDFANSQDEEKSLSSLCLSIKSEKCSNITSGYREEISAFAREHLRPFFDSFDTLIAKNEERNDRWYTVYKNIALFYENFPSLKSTFSLEKLLLRDGECLTGEELLKLEWSCERLYILFSFFQQDPELGAQITSLMGQHENQKKTSLRHKIFFIILTLGSIGLAISLYKTKYITISFPQAKL